MPSRQQGFKEQRMDKQEFEKLLDKYLDGIASENERQLIDDFYDRTQMREPGWESFEEGRKKELASEIYASIQAARKKTSPSESARPGRVRPAIWRLAASVLLIASLLWIYQLNREPILQSVDQTYITRSTAPGQRLTLTLGDGSVVKLNAESSVTFPKTFDPDLREIRLTGEAYFDVTEDANRPFVVTSTSVRTTVLGTTFNINAFDTAGISIGLVTGKVKVESLPRLPGAATGTKILTPGQLALFQGASGEIQVRPFDNNALLAWTRNIIYLKDNTRKEVFDRIARWYGVTFDFENTPDSEWSYSGEFEGMSLETVLNTLSFSEGLEFDIQDKHIKIRFTD